MEYSSHHFDVIVVGAGIMGSSAAYQLAKRGQKTLLLEQFDFLHHRGSSHGESRTVRATYPEDHYCDMVMESSQSWEQAQSEIGYKVYFKAQQFDMGPSDNKSLLAVISSCEKKSLPYQVLHGQQVADRFSGRITVPESWVGVLTEVGGVIKPTKAVSMFQALAFQKGAVLRDNMEVKNIVKDEVRGGVNVVVADGEKFWGKKCVVTAGAWMSKLVKTCVIGGSRRGTRRSLPSEAIFPTFASYGEPYIYGTPSLEFPGLIKIAVHGGYPCDPDKRPWGPGISLDSMKEWIEGRFSGLVDHGEPVVTQLCMYSMTPDGDFVIDFLGGEFGKDVVIGGGFSGHGFKMAPVVGRISGGPCA
ncbi:hypothetical protein OIU84_000078 [Salix udensis]|uniref:FAD dependent oxidoreductase domain-containing protein n=1 Tax=Salix udensis TaxID=889485 RepID=A0AAD6PLZ6_9ROSI|nr:hypothetical protein OIU84_000078 [Salix udensis]